MGDWVNGIELFCSKKVYNSICRLCKNNVAGARGIEPRSKVLETFILTVVLCPFVA